MKNTFKKTAVTQTTEEYASRSSIHGIGYIFDKELNVVDRLLWLLVVLAFLGFSAALTWNFWSQWRNEQVIKTAHHLVSSFPEDHALYTWPNSPAPICTFCDFLWLCTLRLTCHKCHSSYWRPWLPGCDGSEEHCQAGLWRPIPCSDHLWFWTSHEQCGEEVDPGL